MSERTVTAALIIIGTVVTLQSRLAWFKPNAS